MPETPHIPVLYEELLGSLRFFEPGKNIIIDMTLGLAGHASGVIQRLWYGDIFIGVDCDSDNLAQARERLRSLCMMKKPEQSPCIYTVLSNFRHLGEILSDPARCIPVHEDMPRLDTDDLQHITAAYADLWVSSVHFDTPDRGFSFRFDGPLDMRLDRDMPTTAADIIREYPYDKMAEMFRVYGDEPKAWWITKHIINARKIAPITTTQELSDIIKPLSRDALPRVFQALRIAVNDEYGALETMLQESHDHLMPSWSLSLISFHSWEDRIVKNFFKNHSHGDIDAFTGHEIHPGSLRIITKKPITPGQEEILHNPRARSGLLRVAMKV